MSKKTLYCIITQSAYKSKIGLLYRVAPESSEDSGWRLATGFETDEYMHNTDNYLKVTLEVVISIEPKLTELIENDIGAAFMLDDNDEEFLQIEIN